MAWMIRVMTSFGVIEPFNHQGGESWTGIGDDGRCRVFTSKEALDKTFPHELQSIVMY